MTEGPSHNGLRWEQSSHEAEDRPSQIEMERSWAMQAQGGDDSAYEALVERYSVRIFTHVLRMVKSREEAEDITQEVFVKAFRALAQYDVSRPFRSWLYAIATNAALNALRTARRRGVSIALDDDDRAAHDAMVASDDGHGIIARRERALRVTDAVKELPPRSAALVHLHYFEGMSIREAAETVGLSEGAAKVALHRARRDLRERLVDEVKHDV